MLFVLDARKDSASIKAVYEDLVAEGLQLNDAFLQDYNHILLKYSGPAANEAGSPPEVHSFDP